MDKIINIKKLRESQKHRERCRALADYFWSKEPDLKIASMIKKDEIKIFGCERVIYTEKIMRGWINDMRKPEDRLPGRPKKDKNNV